MATELESNLYKQSATYKHFVVLHNLNALASWSVNKNAYDIVMKAIKDLSELKSYDFGEDHNGNLIHDLIPVSKPEWRK